MDALAMLALSWCAAGSSDVAIEHPRFALRLSDAAACVSLAAVSDRRTWDLSARPTPLGEVYVGGRLHKASAASLDGDALTVRFDGTDTVLSYGLEPAEDWVVLRLKAIAGARPDSVTLLRLPAPEGMRIGPRLNAAWDADTTVCLMAATRQADCRAGGAPPTLVATTQDAPGPRLEGAAVALIVCPTPDFKAVARRASHAFGLLTNEAPDGTPVKDTDLVRGSYWFLDVTEANV
ncbi:MAG: hypothetical protein FJX74_19795, partial [Armatimonadetes bacterium]|nr:hypothetical protein [Armatimonadota bacterium]